MSIDVSVSVGEFLDKLTILEIKSRLIEDQEKLKNISNELNTLKDTWAASSFSGEDIEKELDQLREINLQLWNIEDDIRDKEASQEFDDVFVELARAVYVTNDKRADIKKVLNKKLGSNLVEEKSYSDYTNK